MDLCILKAWLDTLPTKLYSKTVKQNPLSFARKKKDPIINNVKLDCQMKDSNDYVIEGQIMVSGLGGEILRARM